MLPLAYRIEWKPSALREFRKLSTDVAAAIRGHVERLSSVPRPPGCVKLAGFDRVYRVRVGAYRIIYEIDDAVLVVHVIRVRPRNESYRGM